MTSHYSPFPKLRVKRLSENATLPQRQTKKAAGYDLCAPASGSIDSFDRKLIPLDLIMEIPDDHYGKIAPRSSLAAKNCIDVGAGVIDCDYRGNVNVLLINMSENVFHYKKGDRIAQLILEKISTPEVEEAAELAVSERGEGGFGSTGK